MLRFLHLTDFHFGDSVYCALQPRKSSKEIAKLLLEDIQQALEGVSPSISREPIDAILLGGDFAHSGRLLHEFGWETAIHFVRGLKRISPQSSLIVIPGNHDVDHGTDPTTSRGLPVPAVIREEPYRRFLLALSRTSPSIESSFKDRYLGTTERFDDGQGGVTLMSLNSCRLERHGAAGWGYIGADQLHWRLTSAPSKKSVRRTALDGDLLIALTHHHLVPCFDLEWPVLFRDPSNRKMSFDVDAVSAEKILRAAGCACVLFGHVHEKRRIRTCDLTDGNGTGDVLHAGAGTVALLSYNGFATSHHFQLIDVEKDERGHTLTFTDFSRPTPALANFNDGRRFSISQRLGVATQVTFSQQRLSALLNDPRYKGNVTTARELARRYESWGDLQRWSQPRRKQLVLEKIMKAVAWGGGADPEAERWVSGELDRLLKDGPNPEDLSVYDLPFYVAEVYRKHKQGVRNAG